jgi:FkbM family methyltransferase
MFASVRQLLRRAGYDVRRHPDPGALGFHLRTLGIDTVLDVGANEGRYARHLRRIGFRGRIISFEPVADIFARLQAASATDEGWDCHPYALGAADTHTEIVVSACSEFSSFLPVQAFTADIHPTARPVRRERVEVRTLDRVWGGLELGGRTVLLKSDTQGFERQVIEGAGASLDACTGVQLELSLRPIYHGQPGFEDLVGEMRRRGFVLSDLVRGFADGWELLEADGLFVRARVRQSEPHEHDQQGCHDQR